MSLQELNTDYQMELAGEERPRGNAIKNAFRRIMSNDIGQVFRGEYPDSRRLEELLCDFD